MNIHIAYGNSAEERLTECVDRFAGNIYPANILDSHADQNCSAAHTSEIILLVEDLN